MGSEYLACPGDYRGRKGVREEVRPGTLSQEVNQFLGSGGVAPRCPAQGLAQCRIDDIYFA